jgi:integrase
MLEAFPAWYAFTLMIFHCGLRANEALSMTVSDMDIKGKRLLVSKTFSKSRNPSGRNIKRTKESKEDREVAIPILDATVLLALKDWIGIRPADSPLFPWHGWESGRVPERPRLRMEASRADGRSPATRIPHRTSPDVLGKIMAGINDYVILPDHSTPLPPCSTAPAATYIPRPTTLS